MDYCPVPKTFFSFFLFQPSNNFKSVVQDIVIGRNGLEYYTQLEIHDKGYTVSKQAFYIWVSDKQS